RDQRGHRHHHQLLPPQRKDHRLHPVLQAPPGRLSVAADRPKITDYIQWYRQLPGRAPAFLVSAFQGSKELQAAPGRLSVAADRRSSLRIQRTQEVPGAAELLLPTGSRAALGSHGTYRAPPRAQAFPPEDSQANPEQVLSSASAPRALQG
uniref:Uncharacterized protein n=1 Tax=Strix occidentalis caurina TaxID=311401 RepID=A0A8D0EVX4_STROC